MDSVITATVCVSRPKVHRLPKRDANVRAKKGQQVKFVAVGGAALLVAGVAILVFTPEKTLLSGRILPAISVGSQDASMIGDAQASVDGTIHAAKRNKIITIHNDSEYIVGQMAKIPAENEQITEIKPINDIDSHAGKELLSIISKY